jgi:serine/threonine protein kinase
LANGDLYTAISKTGPFEESLARYYFKQLLEGLEHMHQKGIAHRDIKLENILFDENFDLKIADMGFAAPIAGQFRTRLGTTCYMAPELFAGYPYHGEVVDLFAAAVILFIMVTQLPPFVANASLKDR